MMNVYPTVWALQEPGPTTGFYLRRRTSIYTIEIAVQRGGGGAAQQEIQDATETEELECVLWASITPSKARQSADGEYNVQLPTVLAMLTLSRSGADDVLLVRPPQRWDIEAGSAVTLRLCAATAAVAATPHTAPTTSTSSSIAMANDIAAGNGHADLPSWLTAVTFRLSGTAMGPTFVPSVCEWRPLLLRRWFELKSHVREATILEPAPSTTHGRHCGNGVRSVGDATRIGQPTHRRRGDGDVAEELVWPVTKGAEGATEAEGTHMYQGDVREARAISANGGFIQWCDGAVGPMEELQPFRRRYTPARAEKTVRVRRYPHRHADVIGHVDFGLVVEAVGKTVDPFTGEYYVLIYLPQTSTHTPLIARYDLAATTVQDRHIWGWTKLGGMPHGQPLLHEVCTAASTAAATTDSYVGRDDVAFDLLLDATTSDAKGRLLLPVAGKSRGQRHARPGARRGIDISDTASGKTGRGCETMGQLGAQSTDAAEGQRQILTSPRYYISVRAGKGVRIRAKPSLRARTVGALEPNEVKEAVALVHVPPVKRTSSVEGDKDDPSAVVVGNEFVEWEDGTYSLLRNHERTFLAEVNLRAGIRRYPVRSRLSGATTATGQSVVEGGDACSESEVIDLDETRRAQARQKRSREAGGGACIPNFNDAGAPGVSTRESSATFDLPRSERRRMEGNDAEDELLSPNQVPMTLREGVRSGSVRLADLPVLPASTADTTVEDEAAFDALPSSASDVE